MKKAKVKKTKVQMTITGQPAEIFKHLKEESGYSYTRISEEILRLAEQATVYKRERDLLLNNFTHGYPQNFVPPVKEFVAPKRLKIDIRFTGDITTDLAAELMQAVEMGGPSEVWKSQDPLAALKARMEEEDEKARIKEEEELLNEVTRK